MTSTKHRRTSGAPDGFTLVELIVTMLVASILLAVAVPTYTSQIRSSRRTDARSAVLDLAGREERYLSVNTAYSTTPSDLGYTGSFPQSIGSGYYQVSVTATAATATTPPAFTAPATAGGKQTADTSCASFTVNHLGQHTAQDSGGSDSTATCWAGN